MICDQCNNKFNDGVRCESCKRNLDFGCAAVSETTYRKYGADRKAAWKCPRCKNPPPNTNAGPGPCPGPGSADAASEPASMELILKELRDVKSQLTCLPIIISDIKSIKTDIENLKASCEFNSASLDEYKTRLTQVEQKLPELQCAQDSISRNTDEVTKLKNELVAKEQWARLNNIEIKGVPLKKNENLFSIVESLSKEVDYVFPKEQINYIARVPVHNSKEKLIIVSFINRYIKEEFMSAARVKKSILTSDIGYGEVGKRIFVNDHLTPFSKSLLTKTKATASGKSYRYVWVKYAKIHVRKNDTSPVIVISDELDLNKIA